MDAKNTFDERLGAAFTALVDSEYDADAEARLVAAHPTPQATTRHLRRKAVYAVGGIGAAAAAVIVINAFGLNGSTSEPDSSLSADGSAPLSGTAGNEPEGVVAPTEPCGPAVHGAPAELKTDIPIFLPRSEASNVTDSWTCGSTPVLVFGGDVQVSYEGGWDGVDIQKKWASLAETYGGHVTTITGRPALVQPVAETKGTNNQVLIVEGDTLIRVLSKGEVPIDELTRLAESLEIGKPALPLGR